MILEPLITVYVLEMGVDRSQASLSSGIVFSAVGIAAVLMAPRWGRIGGRTGFAHVLLIGLIGSGIGNILQFFITNFVGFGALRFGYGLFYASVMPAINAMTVEVTKPEFRGRAFSLSQSATQLATMAGPLIGGMLGSWMPIRWIFVLNGGILLLAALLLGVKGKNVFPVSAKKNVTDQDIHSAG